MMTTEDVEKYTLLSKSDRHKRLVSNTLETIHKALSNAGEWAISFSGGKDSTVLADLLSVAGWKGKGIYFVYSDYENPKENLQQVEWAGDHYGYDIHVVKRYGDYDCWKEVGHFFVIPETENEKSAMRKISNVRKTVSREFMRSNGLRNLFIGMRKEESRTRQIVLRKKGMIYSTQIRDGLTCCPLANWKGSDIWAYIVSNDLPYLSIYDLPYWNRERIRNELTVISCSNAVLRGEFLQYRIAYPDLFQKLKTEFPGVMMYT